MIKIVSMLSVTFMSVGLVAGCAVDTDEPVTGDDVPTDEASQALGKTPLGNPLVRKLFCGMEKADAVDGQQAAGAFYQFLTAGSLAGVGNTATAADKAAYAAAGGQGSLGATTFSKFYAPATTKGTRFNIDATNNAAATLKAMLDQGTLALGDAAPGSVCMLTAGLRGVYGASGSLNNVVALIDTFNTNAVAMGYPVLLPRFITSASAQSGGSSGGPGLPGNPGGGGPIGGGGTSSGGFPPVMQPLFYVDPEPARMFENLTGSNGTTGLATYVNSGESTYGVRWSSMPQVGSPALGAACSTADITAGTEMYRAIQVMSDGKRRCK